MTVFEEVKRGCGCVMSMAHGGHITIVPCEAARGVDAALRTTPDCELGDDVWGDLSVFIDPLRDFFRYGGGLKHEP